ncbi:hypothetical protein C8F04DRAFT_1319512 [Mycena alexandri]|uniref:Uncharacterized protein n=1 Tax=Mycena alexandri TaxID=1745969 RepID=A0AAD6WT68_9AGAR|nr:hypothetical protein C8F04DRAFT_1319512 [Mycena alexandri]
MRARSHGAGSSVRMRVPRNWKRRATSPRPILTANNDRNKPTEATDAAEAERGRLVLPVMLPPAHAPFAPPAPHAACTSSWRQHRVRTRQPPLQTPAPHPTPTHAPKLSANSTTTPLILLPSSASANTSLPPIPAAAARVDEKAPPLSAGEVSKRVWPTGSVDGSGSGGEKNDVDDTAAGNVYHRRKPGPPTRRVLLRTVSLRISSRSCCPKSVEGASSPLAWNGTATGALCVSAYVASAGVSAAVVLKLDEKLTDYKYGILQYISLRSAPPPTNPRDAGLVGTERLYGTPMKVPIEESVETSIPGAHLPAPLDASARYLALRLAAPVCRLADMRVAFFDAVDIPPTLRATPPPSPRHRHSACPRRGEHNGNGNAPPSPHYYRKSSSTRAAAVPARQRERDGSNDGGAALHVHAQEASISTGYWVFAAAGEARVLPMTKAPDTARPSEVLDKMLYRMPVGNYISRK